MIPKVVGYAAFQSYGDLPYPSLKAGKRTLDSNQVWEQSTNVNEYQLLEMKIKKAFTRIPIIISQIKKLQQMNQCNLITIRILIKHTKYYHC